MEKQIALKQLVGDNIRSLRKARGMSQEEVGEKADLSYKFVGEVERGGVNPSLESLEGIANALGVEVVRLFMSNDFVALSGDEIQKARSALSTLNSILGDKKTQGA